MTKANLTYYTYHLRHATENLKSNADWTSRHSSLGCTTQFIPGDRQKKLATFLSQPQKFWKLACMKSRRSVPSLSAVSQSVRLSVPLHFSIQFTKAVMISIRKASASAQEHLTSIAITVFVVPSLLQWFWSLRILRQFRYIILLIRTWAPWKDRNS